MLDEIDAVEWSVTFFYVMLRGAQLYRNKQEN